MGLGVYQRLKLVDGQCLHVQGSEWKARTAAHYRHKDDAPGSISIFEAFSASYWGRRRDVAANPVAATASGAGTLGGKLL